MQLPFDATEAVECFAKAIETKHESAAKTASTKAGFTAGPGEGPWAFFGMLTQTTYTLVVKPNSARVKGQMAVVQATVMDGIEEKFPLYFFVEERMGNWRIDGVSKSKAYADKVLLGEAPSLLDITKLPKNTDVVSWAEDLIAYFDGEEVAESEVEGVQGLIDLWHRTVPRAEADKTFIKHTLDVPWFNRAAVMFETELATYADHRWLVAQKREDGRWEPVWFGMAFEPNCLFLKL